MTVADFDSCETTLEKPTHTEQKIAERRIDLFYSTDSLEQSVIKQIVNEQKIQHEGDPQFMLTRQDDIVLKYLTWDVSHTRKLYDKIQKEKNKAIIESAIQRVIFNPPATIVFWRDGSKTVVKCGENDIFDPEKGLAMAISKRVFGKWIGKYEYQQKRKEKKK